MRPRATIIRAAFLALIIASLSGCTIVSTVIGPFVGAGVGIVFGVERSQDARNTSTAVAYAALVPLFAIGGAVAGTVVGPIYGILADISFLVEGEYPDFEFWTRPHWT